MIVNRCNGIRKTNYGVNFLVLAYGTQSMVTKMLYKHGDAVPRHAHPNEQSGYVLSGKYRIRFSDYNREIGPGDSYSIPANIEHSFDIIVAGEVVDVFVPPRQDFL